MTLGIRIDDLDAPPLGYDEDDNLVPCQRPESERFGSGMLTTDLAYARVLFQHLKIRVLCARHEQPEFWMYKEEDRLWHQNTDLMKVVGVESAQPPLLDYIESLSDDDLSKTNKCREAARLSNMAGLCSLFRAVQNMFETSRTDDTALIDKRMDQTPGLLPLTDGLTLDLKTGISRLRTRDDFFSKFCPFAPVVLTGSDRDWIQNYFTQLLRVRDADKAIVEPSPKHVLFLQYCLSYVLTGEVCSAVWFQFSGSGSNGKSSLLEVLLSCLGPFGVSGINRAWTTKEGQEPACHDAERIQLIGKRLCVLSEIGEHSFFDAEFLKKTSAGDMQSFRECHGSSKSTIQTKLSCVAIAATNHIIRVQKVDPAFIRRMCCFHFGNVFDQSQIKNEEIKVMSQKIMTVLCEVAHTVYSNPRQYGILCSEEEKSDEVKAYTEEVVLNQNPVWQWLEFHSVQKINDGPYEVNADTTLFLLEAYDSFYRFRSTLVTKEHEDLPRVKKSDFIDLVSKRMEFGRLVQSNSPNDRRQYWPRSRWVKNPPIQ